MTPRRKAANIASFKLYPTTIPAISKEVESVEAECEEDDKNSGRARSRGRWFRYISTSSETDLTSPKVSFTTALIIPQYTTHEAPNDMKKRLPETICRVQVPSDHHNSLRKASVKKSGHNEPLTEGNLVGQPGQDEESWFFKLSAGFQ